MVPVRSIVSLLRRAWLGALLLLVGLPVAAGPTVVDDAGHTVRLDAPARRIVSLAPHLTESLYAAGAGAQLVGAVEYSDWPEAAQAVPRVGGFNSLDLEAILALRPDLVVAWESGNLAAHLDQLRALGLTLYLSEPRRLEEIPATLERLGVLAGTETVAGPAAAAFRARHAALRERYAEAVPVSVFYQVWHQPLMTVGGSHLISDLIALCGGRNIFAGLNDLAPTVGLEAVLAADPQVIVASGMDRFRPEWLDRWRDWPQLRAVQGGHLYAVPPDLVQRNGPRVLEGAERICEALERARP